MHENYRQELMRLRQALEGVKSTAEFLLLYGDRIDPRILTRKRKELQVYYVCAEAIYEHLAEIPEK